MTHEAAWQAMRATAIRMGQRMPQGRIRVPDNENLMLVPATLCQDDDEDTTVPSCLFYMLLILYREMATWNWPLLRRPHRALPQPEERGVRVRRLSRESSAPQPPRTVSPTLTADTRS
jgi:hypothetical protein